MPAHVLAHRQQWILSPSRLGAELHSVGPGIGGQQVTTDAHVLRRATGAYFYRLQAGGFVETKRLMILKKKGRVDFRYAAIVILQRGT
jgi:hypothetical protein